MKHTLKQLFADYGMLVVLLLLCAFYSVITMARHDPQGAAAGEQVAAEIERGRQVIVMTGDGEDDRAFAEAMERESSERGFTIVEVVQGTPADGRAALTRLIANATRIDVFALSGTSRGWAIFDGFSEKFPALANKQLLSPHGYTWPIFLTRANLLNVINQIVLIAVIAIGMTMVIITGGIDLSVGSLVALSGVVTTMIIRDFAGGVEANAGAMVLASMAGVAVCAVIGVFTGAMVTVLSIPPFIVTLAMMLVASGLALKLAQGESISAIPPAFTWLGRGTTAGIPNAIWLIVVLYAMAHIVMSRMTLGRCIYAIGGNAEAARLSGIPVRRVVLLVYAVSGAMAGFGGVILASQLGSGVPIHGIPYELYVIAAVVVGGTSLMGGEGKVLGTLIGAFIIAVISNGMNLTNVDPYNQKIVLGAVILAAVLLDRVKKSNQGIVAKLFRRRASGSGEKPQPGPATSASNGSSTRG